MARQRDSGVPALRLWPRLPRLRGRWHLGETGRGTRAEPPLAPPPPYSQRGARHCKTGRYQPAPSRDPHYQQERDQQPNPATPIAANRTAALGPPCALAPCRCGQSLTAINTPTSQISPVFFGDQLVYLHQPPNGKVDQNSGNIFYEMFQYNLGENNRKKPKPFATELKSTHHEGPLTFSGDLKQVFFTRTNIRQGVVQINQRGKAGLKIYYAFKGPYEWQGVRELPFNSDEYSCLHPTLSSDGNRIFFASDRPGGFGGLDLYLSEWIDGKWGNPINLGPEINTSKDEAFPFIHDSNRLFFASDGHLGLGGWDVFMIDLGGRNWGKVYNLPEPYNSVDDDFGFIIDPAATYGFLSSDRPGGAGKDDIYRFTVPQGIEGFTGHSSTRELLTVYDAGSSRQLVGAEVWLMETTRPSDTHQPPVLEANADGTLRLVASQRNVDQAGLIKLQTDLEGKADLLLSEGKSYRVMMFKSGFAPSEIRFDYGANGPSRPLETALQPSNCIMITGQIVDSQHEYGIGKVEVQFYPVDCNATAVKATTDPDGTYYACIPKGCNYQVVAKHPEYEKKTSAVGTVRPRVERLTNNLELTALAPTAADNILHNGAVIVLENLAYDGNQFELVPQTTGELELLVGLLKDRPKLKVALSNHTETGGPAAYFQEMSQRRIASIRDFLAARGIAVDRLQLVAHGVDVPRNECSDITNCTPDQHLKNRRTEVKILSMGVR
ncbi:MAG: OmpA family protein [Bacteroidota bacterium]